MRDVSYCIPMLCCVQLLSTRAWGSFSVQEPRGYIMLCCVQLLSTRAWGSFSVQEPRGYIITSNGKFPMILLWCNVFSIIHAFKNIMYVVLTVPSLFPHCPLTVPSLSPHCSLTVPSLSPHCPLCAALSSSRVQVQGCLQGAH